MWEKRNPRTFIADFSYVCGYKCVDMCVIYIGVMYKCVI